MILEWVCVLWFGETEPGGMEIDPQSFQEKLVGSVEWHLMTLVMGITVQGAQCISGSGKRRHQCPLVAKVAPGCVDFTNFMACHTMQLVLESFKFARDNPLKPISMVKSYSSCHTNLTDTAQ